MRVAACIEEDKIHFWGSKSSLIQTRELVKIKTTDLKENVFLSLANRAITVALLGKGFQRTPRRNLFYSTTDRPIMGLEIKKKGNIFIHDAIEFAIESNTLGLDKISLQAKQIITPDGINYNAEFSRSHSPNIRKDWTLKNYNLAYLRWLDLLNPSLRYNASELGILNIDIPAAGGDKVEVDYQSEPKITFNVGSDMTHNWPQGGLKQFGPLDFNLGSSKPEIKVALVTGGNKGSFSYKYLKMLNEGQGFHQRFYNTYKARLIMKSGTNTDERIEAIDLQKLLSTSNIEEVGKLYLQAITNIKNRTDAFDVAIIEIPNLLINHCRKFSVDLRDYLKVIFLEQQVATQLLTEDTAIKIENNPSASLSNFALGLYVSAGGIPWRLEEHSPDTAFMGISFGIKKHTDGSSEILVGIAEITDEYGVSLAIKAVSSKYDRKQGVHLNSKDINSLIPDLLELYETETGSSPQRVIVHKTTHYNKEEESIISLLEKRGIEINLLHIQDSNIKLIQDGENALTRGMYWQISDDEILIYTDGIVSYLNKAIHIWPPNPLLVRKHYGQQNITEAVRDILCLTKLNWNSTNNHEKYPVTISHARKVVNLLRAGLDRESIIDDFRYYF